MNLKLTMTLCTLMFAGLAMAPSASADSGLSGLVDADSGLTEAVDAVIPWPCYIYVSTPGIYVGHPFIGYTYVKGHTVCIN